MDQFYKPVPAWYELEFKAPASLIIRIHNNAWDAIKHVFKNDDSGVARLLGLPAFISPDHSSWGFGPVMKRVKQLDPDWMGWKIALPEGELREAHHAKFVAISAILEQVVLPLFAQQVTDATKSQLMWLDHLRAEPGVEKGYVLSVSFSPALLNWLRKTDLNKVMAAVTKVMRRTTRRVGSDEMMAQECNFIISLPNRFLFQCWGMMGGVTLGTTSSSLDECDGLNFIKLTSDNVDNPLQQLSILAGLGELHRVARLEGA